MSILTSEGKLTPVEANFHFTNAGMGDYICWLSAIKFIHDQYPHVTGHLWGVGWFVPLMEELIKDWPGWTARPRDLYDEEGSDTIKSYFCQFSHHALGFHMIDYGFHIFCNMTPPPPEWNYYVEFKPDVDIKKFNLPGEYVVITPCATTPVRTQTPESWNGFKNYLISQGITPVMVGQTLFGGRCNPPHEEYNFDGTLSLLNCTSLLESQAVLANAMAVVGLDNGLLHLASTSSVPIVFGQNIASPVHRAPRRREGKHIHLTPGLPCDFCQSKLRFTDHIFTHCIYEHYNCLKALDTKRWIAAFEQLMESA